MTVPEASKAVKLQAPIVPWHPCRRGQMLRARALISRGPQSPEIGRASRARHFTGSATNPPGCLQHDQAAISQGAAIGSRPSGEMPFRPSGPDSGTRSE
ncbi:hypothetical protein COCMIDRAFT_32048 [Bipolaris oryzae ATCC 44560]|uniref:Uncharacterized protein n=1 Tax=Bipolaris oryzae ATCC 44560 TaxID=930090 RepID=W6ZG87_COCMI|nr:uncharacterized protein COCMIDRAFT_32048 [Bipolaris oryzae ATCC 44560]EUC50832.1 hypothetical protein COCMIDRAFT_32048 [Bipolaris oryzae ATCC 44560]